jgi:hypothetical protein
MNQPDENLLWTLFSKKLSGEISNKELLELESLLKKEPQSAYALEILAQWWISSTQAPENANEAHRAFQKHLARLAGDNTANDIFQ